MKETKEKQRGRNIDTKKRYKARAKGEKTVRENLKRKDIGVEGR
jgi:hypothetical protein